VRRILFDPAGTHPDDPAYERVTSWAECGDLLLTPREAFA